MGGFAAAGVGLVSLPVIFGVGGAGAFPASGAVIFHSLGGVGASDFFGGSCFVPFPAAFGPFPTSGFVPLAATAADGAGIVVLDIIIAVPFATLGKAVSEEPAVRVTVDVMIFGGVEMVDVMFWPATSWVIVVVVLGWLSTMMITWTKEELEEEELVLPDDSEDGPDVSPNELDLEESLELELELLDPELDSMLIAGTWGAV
jgi:hypothetical protein